MGGMGSGAYGYGSKVRKWTVEETFHLDIQDLKGKLNGKTLKMSWDKEKKSIGILTKYNERIERIQSRLASYAEESVKMMELAKSAESESVRVTALKDVLDRAGYKAVDKAESKNEHSGKIVFGFQDPNEE
jgi:hypothetical protein